MRMPAKNDSLNLTLPAAILELGQAIAASHAGTRINPRIGAPVDPQRLVDAEDRLLAMVKADVKARRIAGIKMAGQDESERRVRLRAVALLAHRSLGQPLTQPVSEISDVAHACMDRKLAPGESILRARDAIGRMIAEDTLIGGGDADGACEKARLSTRTLEWLSGGKSSLGFLTMRRLVGMLLPEGMEDADPPPPAQVPIPSIKDLHSRICERVIGLDDHARMLSSRLVMHLVRAKMLQAGKDPGTGNQAVLLAGSPGCGKTHLLSEASRLVGCPFASVAATSMTSEGYVGGKLDDLFRALVSKAKGDLNAARFGVAFADEWDAKAMRAGRDVTTLALQQEALVPMQGGEFQISGKRSMERPVTFNSVGTFFAFAGAFPGLREQIKKKTRSSCIGFSAGNKTRCQEYLLNSIMDYGYIRAWVNRLTAVMFLDDPQVGSLEKAAAGGVLDSFNALVGELGIVLFPHGAATARMAEYALESRTFYRGIKSVWWGIAEQAVASGERGTVLVGTAEVEAAIGRVSSGAASGAGAEMPQQQGALFDGGQDDDTESNGAGG